MPPHSRIIAIVESSRAPVMHGPRYGSLIGQFKLTVMERLIVNVIRHGRTPRHLAVIMDGNRRYARLHAKAAIEGHRQGFEKLSEVLFWCRQLGIEEVTVYAFSIENFKRDKAEVDSLMELAAEKFREILADRERLTEEGVRIRFIGNRAYLSEELQQVCADLTLATKDNSRCFLNIAFSYTSRDEICTAIEDLLAGAKEGIVKPRHFSETLLSSAMYSRESPDPDFLIRTSGEVRLSDFLLWQTGFTVVEFIPSLWPQLTIWQFLGAVVQYQWQARKITNLLSSRRLRDETKFASRSQAILPEETARKEAEFDEFVQRRRTQQLKDASLGKTSRRLWTDM